MARTPKQLAMFKEPRKRIARASSGKTLADVERPGMKAAYMRGQGGAAFFHSWRPALREAADDVRASWVSAASRAVDTIQNSGWIAGGVEQAVAMTVGTGLRLTCKPDKEALGWTEDAANAWSRTVERRWEGWANRAIECDIEGKATVGKLSAQALRTHFCYGEILATLPYLRRPFAQYGTKVQLLPPHRLAQDSILSDRLFQGVWRDSYGFPVGYRITDPPYEPYTRTYRDVAARDPFGRPSVIHVFDGMPGQVRGIPPITPALKVVRQFDQLSDATLTASLIQAIFAATVTSPEPTEAVLQAFQDLAEQSVPINKAPVASQTSPFAAMMDLRAGWYDSTQIDLGRSGKIAHMAPGDKLEFHTSNHPNSTYEQFVRFLLREIARCLGITFEQLTGDYTGATYSSVRMATSESWMITLYRRVHVIAPFMQPLFEAWLEEEIERGWISFPGGVDGYLIMRGAAARAHWRGPAKPQADDMKFASAIETLKNLGVITDEWICAELGDDWEDTYEQRAREMQMRAKLKLPEINPPPPTPLTGTPNDQRAIKDQRTNQNG